MEKMFVWDSAETLEWLSSSEQAPEPSVIENYLMGYSGILCYHGCRPSSVASYYELGLRIGHRDTLTDQARSFFLSGRFPRITPEMFDEALKSFPGYDQIRPRLYVVLDKRFLIQDCGHYLLYGSEHIMGIGARLPRGHGVDYREVLRNEGKPTVLSVRVDPAVLPDEQMGELITEIQDAWTIRRLPAVPTTAMAFTFNKDLPPDCIMGHEEIVGYIRNPLPKR